jgi:multiple sugar transport system ATP-binding protein
MAEIELKNLVKRFGTVEVIKSLDLTIADREFFTFVGPSGCGKSTVLNLIAGLEDVTEGTVVFDGKVINELSPGARDVAMVFQSYALYPHMNVFENIAFPLRVRKEKQATITSEVNRIAGLLGIGDQIKKVPRELSGGQRQRVALGRAMIRRPKVFLMDEPLSNLDARLRVEMRTELKKLHRELGITIVYVTHDQEEAMSLSDKVAVLLEGRVEQCAVPIELYERPANIFVAGFMGSPAMNFIKGSVTSEEPFRVGAGRLTVEPEIKISSKRPVGEEVVIGMRPEDVEVSMGPMDGGYEALCDVVEPAGPFKWVEFTPEGLEGKRIKGKAPVEESINPGERVFFRPAFERVYLFDAASEKRIF